MDNGNDSNDVRTKTSPFPKRLKTSDTNTFSSETKDSTKIHTFPSGSHQQVAGSPHHERKRHHGSAAKGSLLEKIFVILFIVLDVCWQPAIGACVT